MTTATAHRLEGLEPDNLLAFLALLGLLRALEAAGWRPRAHWEGLPLRPVLTLREAKTQEQVAQAAAEGCMVLAKDHDFDGEKDLTFQGERARSLLEAAQRPDTPGRSALLGSLFSDGAINKNGVVIQSPLCPMKSGTGHQHFLQRLCEVPVLDTVTHAVTQDKSTRVRPNRAVKQTETVPASQSTANGRQRGADIRKALYLPWSYLDKTPAFRWDPSEDRRYALRFGDPGNTSRNPIRTVHGANRLAAVGLAALPSAAVQRASQVILLNIGSEKFGPRDDRISWPIWRFSCSLPALQALIAHPAIVAQAPDKRSLALFGITEVRRARRIEKKVAAGVYVNFTRGEVV